ncbi:efflux RND transporter periplasmic adaptor subunit [Alcaligenaceae bacterium 429]|uniref:efflux RND transporter periplasmic adaptor subunit n=1 Tax=Paenalcaligenes sp. Me52 TaxID=3392038 RepID=UPI0010923A87|nr:efflux RND transporter periplasmic adaptor subunit [Alcaligenaceae bacterium 429]
MKKKWVIWGILAILIVGVGLVYGGAKLLVKDAGTRQPSNAKLVEATEMVATERVGVQVADAQFHELQRSLSAVGSLKARDSVALRAEITGTIKDIAFEEGQPIERGQILVRLDDSIAQAQLLEAKAKLSLASSQHQRSRRLSEQGFISSQARDESASQLQVAQAAVALAQAQLDKTVILAPFSGLAGLKNISVGDYVSPGSELLLLEAVDMLEIDFRIPEQYLSRVSPGTLVTARVDAFPKEEYDGQVTAINPVVDAAGRSLWLRARLPNESLLLRPGLFARVTLQLGTDSVVMVPESAIQPAGEAQYVFLVVDGIAQRTEVKVGSREAGWVEVQGVAPGEVVVVSGVQKLVDGTSVLIQQPK